MRKRPKSVGLSPRLAAFLATPVRLPPANTPLERLSEDCKRIVDELLRQASVDKILPSATLGVVYLSLEPKSGALALRSHLLWWGGDDAGRLRALAGYAYAAHFNREARSFFQRIPRSK